MMVPGTRAPVRLAAAPRDVGVGSAAYAGAGGGTLCLERNPPADWASLALLPCESVGFAEAMRTMGYRPWYLWNDRGAGLALVRGWFPGIGPVTARANLFTPGAGPDFVADALRALAGRGIPYVKVGDTMWGLPWCELPTGWPFERTRVVQRHTISLDLSMDEEKLLKGQDVSVRTSVRKAEREGITVGEVRSPEDLAPYLRLAGETTARVRRSTAYTDFPAAFFQALHARMTPTGAARIYVASLGATPLAGCIILCSDREALYYAGASTRDRRWTSLQAPTAVLWHAIREAKRLGMTRFDLGGCTPTEDRSDPRYGVYAFKKRWGGRLETFYNLEVVLGPMRHRLQERVLAPVWDRLHPVYFRLRESLGAR